MKTKLLLFIVLLTALACEDDLESLNDQTINVESELKTKKDVNQHIMESLVKTGDFKWSSFNVNELWVAHSLSDNVSTFYWDEHAQGSEFKTKIINTLVSNVDSNKSKDDLIIDVDDDINFAILKVDSQETFNKLYNLAEVVYVEPFYNMFSEAELAALDKRVSEYMPQQKPNTDINSNTNQRSSVRIPENPALFTTHGIPTAWEHNLTGRGIGVGIVDNGIYNFDDGGVDLFFSQGGDLHGNNPYQDRTLFRIGKHIPHDSDQFDGPWARSGDGSGNHGSYVARVICGPSSETTGVAYQSNVYTVRSSDFIGLFTPERKLGVTTAFNHLRENPTIQVIAMCQGGLLYHEGIRRALARIRYHPNHQRRKLVFSAAGTFPFSLLFDILDVSLDIYIDEEQLNREFTLFPAREEQIAHAVTGTIWPWGTNNFEYADWAFNCHGKAEFVAHYKGISGYFSGTSSESTSLMAGMAALIWENEPNLTRDEVHWRMRRSADRTNWEDRHHLYGFGRVNMEKYLEYAGIIE